MKRKKRYYVCYIADDNRIEISMYMTYIAQCVGISAKTIARHTRNSNIYKTDRFIVWKDVEIHAIKRGFALKNV